MNPELKALLTQAKEVIQKIHGFKQASMDEVAQALEDIAGDADNRLEQVAAQIENTH